jgi:hypothetical protein
MRFGTPQGRSQFTPCTPAFAPFRFEPLRRGSGHLRQDHRRRYRPRDDNVCMQAMARTAVSKAALRARIEALVR